MDNVWINDGKNFRFTSTSTIFELPGRPSANLACLSVKRQLVMPIITNNPAVQGASGMLGNNFVYRQVYGRTIMANRPKKREKLSEKQLAQTDRFSNAAYYATKQTEKPEFKRLYQRGIDLKKGILSAYAVALRDFLNAPKIEQLDVKDYNGEPGQFIRVRATDDFMVSSVTITITNAENQVIEKGEAIARGKKGLWRMMTMVRNTQVKGTVITVVAKDLPGNETTRTLTIA
jgi:hypothetical protein